jgi:hypothetical protein
MANSISYTDPATKLVATYERISATVVQCTLSGGGIDAAKAPEVSAHDSSRGFYLVGGRLVRDADPDAVKLAFATSLAPQSYSGAALDGASMSAGSIDAASVITFTLAYSVGCYVGPIVVTDSAGSESVDVPSDARDGRVTLQTRRVFSGALTVALPAQSTAAGSIQIGKAAVFKSAKTWPVVTRGATAAAARSLAESFARKHFPNAPNTPVWPLQMGQTKFEVAGL